MATLVQFSKNMLRRSNQVGNAPARVLRRVGRATLKALIEATPVDKGVARSNWRVSLGQPTRSVIGAYSPGKNLGRGERANANAAISAGFQVLNRIRPGRGFVVQKSMYIVNSAPYIGKLNSGSSTQSPAGFVETATAAASQVVDGFRVFER